MCFFLPLSASEQRRRQTTADISFFVLDLILFQMLVFICNISGSKKVCTKSWQHLLASRCSKRFYNFRFFCLSWLSRSWQEPESNMETSAPTATEKKECKSSGLDGSSFSEIPKKPSPTTLTRGTALFQRRCRMIFSQVFVCSLLKEATLPQHACSLLNASRGKHSWIFVFL